MPKAAVLDPVTRVARARQRLFDELDWIEVELLTGSEDLSLRELFTLDVNGDWATSLLILNRLDNDKWRALAIDCVGRVLALAEVVYGASDGVIDLVETDRYGAEARSVAGV